MRSKLRLTLPLMIPLLAGCGSGSSTETQVEPSSTAVRSTTAPPTVEGSTTSAPEAPTTVTAPAPSPGMTTSATFQDNDPDYPATIRIDVIRTGDCTVRQVTAPKFALDLSSCIEVRGTVVKAEFGTTRTLANVRLLQLQTPGEKVVGFDCDESSTVCLPSSISGPADSWRPVSDNCVSQGAGSECTFATGDVFTIETYGAVEVSTGDLSRFAVAFGAGDVFGGAVSLTDGGILPSREAMASLVSPECTALTCLDVTPA